MIEEKLPKTTEKPWGHELLYALTPFYAGKIIYVKKGGRLSLQYHVEKDESMYLLEGKIKLSLQPQNGILKETTETPGWSCHLPPTTIHRIEALEDSVILEVSTPQLDDVVRVKDDYGRAK